MRVVLSLVGSLALLPLGGRAARADGLSDLQRQHDRLTAHRERLEGQLAEQSRRIRRLKAQPAGVARDYQLESALRASQQLAARLTGLQQRLHVARGALTTAYDAAIRQADAKLQVVLRRRRALLARPKGQGANTRIVTGDRSSPYDSAEDLEEKADLLSDSEEKVRRQLQRLQRQLSALQHRARLRRHARAADDDPFVENAPRRTSRVSAARKPAEPAAPGVGAGQTATSDDSASRGGVVAPAPPAADSEYDGKSNSGESPPAVPADPSSDMAAGAGPPPAPAPQPTGTGGWSGGGTPAQDGISVSVTIRDVIDPSLLRKLGQAGQGGDVKTRIAALRRATAKLGHLAGRLSKQASVLRKRARRLRSGR